jgi:hypothetical protein
MRHLLIDEKVTPLKAFYIMLQSDISTFSPTACVVGAATAYASLVYLHRYRSWYRLQAQPPPTSAEDAYSILHNFMVYDYPLFTTLSLEIGFLKTYGIPSISVILAGTRELVERYVGDTIIAIPFA